MFPASSRFSLHLTSIAEEYPSTAEGSGLENRQGLNGSRGFESLLLHAKKIYEHKKCHEFFHGGDSRHFYFYSNGEKSMYIKTFCIHFAFLHVFVCTNLLSVNKHHVILDDCGLIHWALSFCSRFLFDNNSGAVHG